MSTTSTAVVPMSASVTAYVQVPGGWFLNNSGWILGRERTLLVDTCATEKRSRQLLAAAQSASISDAPVAVALTHAHRDHVNGACLVAGAGGTVLATLTAAKDITTGPHTYPEVFDFQDWGEITPPHHIEPVNAPTTLDLGQATAEMFPVPYNAHTNGDLVILADDGGLFTGDLVFSGVTPTHALRLDHRIAQGVGTARRFQSQLPDPRPWTSNNRTVGRNFWHACTKHGHSFFDTLVMLTEGQPWLPAHQ